MKTSTEANEEMIRRYQTKIADLRQELEPSDAGWRKVDLRTGVDTTDAHTEQVKKDIAIYERVIAARSVETR